MSARAGLDQAEILAQILEKLDELTRKIEDADVAQRAEFASLRAELAELRRAPHAPELVAQLRAVFQDSAFSAKGVFAAAERHVELYDVLVEFVDFESTRAGAIALGRLLGRLAEVELVRKERGVSLYRLRD